MQEYFAKFKSNLEFDSTLAESISSRHNAIRAYLENNHPDFKDSKLIGSFKRSTRIHPGTGHKFDIDILVIMGEFYRWVNTGGISAEAAMHSLHNTIQKSPRYGVMNPIQDAPTVSLTYSQDDIDVELVPAYIDKIGEDQSGNQLGNIGRGYWVPKNGAWEIADYDYEAEYISGKNKVANNELVPIIKMIKAVKGIHFPKLSSFPLEILVADIIPTNIELCRYMSRPLSYPDLLKNFFDLAPARLTKSIEIPGSKSKPITLDQSIVLELIGIFSKISQHIQYTSTLANKQDKVAAWRKLFGNYFPSTI